MLKKSMDISNIITITLIPFTILGKIIFSIKTTSTLIKSLKNILHSTYKLINILQQNLLFYNQIHLSKDYFFSILRLNH